MKHAVFAYVKSCWNQGVLNNECKDSCSRKQQESN